MRNFCLQVSGSFACFTRPEMKVERMSYDVITPSSARAIFEAVLWKPAIRWSIHKIEILKPIRWINLRRNEVGKVMPIVNPTRSMQSGKPIFLNVEDERQQRAGLFLRDVRYRLHASFEITGKAGNGDTTTKFAEMFRRRAGKGQCFNQPYLGCREFSADFSLGQTEVADSPPIDESRDLGWMLYDLDFSTPSDPKPMFFHARMEHGVVEVPTRDSEEVRR